MMAWLALTVAVFANVVANISFKLAVTKAPIGLFEYRIFSFVAQPWTWIGSGAAIVLLLSYLVAIRDLGLGASYAIVTSLALVMVRISAAYVFQERLNLASILGMTLVVLGIAVLVVNEMAT